MTVPVGPNGSNRGMPYPPAYTNPTGAPNAAYGTPSTAYGSALGRGSDPHTRPGDPWAQSLQLRPGQTPDPMRVKQMPVHTMYPDADEAPAEFYNGIHGTSRDLLQRHSVEYQKADPWETDAPNVKRFEDNPRTRLYPEARPTSRNSPNSYSFTRPYDQRNERRLTGVHFSMADHRRNYPVFGMAPAKTWRNTSRVDPPPWDANIVDSNNGPITTLAPQIPNYEVPMNSQAWVLGG